MQLKTQEARTDIQDTYWSRGQLQLRLSHKPIYVFMVQGISQSKGVSSGTDAMSQRLFSNEKPAAIGIVYIYDDKRRKS